MFFYFCLSSTMRAKTYILQTSLLCLTSPLYGDILKVSILSKGSVLLKKFDVNLSPSDVKAILCALQIVPLVVTNNPIQMEINISNAASGAEKLLSCPEELTPNELRIISGAVSASLLYIRNPDNNMFSSSEAAYRRELSQYLFTLNRLDPILQKAIGL